MKIEKKLNGTSLVIALEGRLDTMTSPELEKTIKELTDAESLVIDCKDLEYVSSAGLRVLLGAHKSFDSKGGFVLKNVCETVLDILEVTGFNNILNIK